MISIRSQGLKNEDWKRATSNERRNKINSILKPFGYATGGRGGWAASTATTLTLSNIEITLER